MTDWRKQKVGPKEIEQAIITEIDENIAAFKTVRGYNGDFDDVTEETLPQIVKLFPAALVIYDGSEFERSGGRLQRNARFAVILADKSLRGEADPTIRRGLYDLLDTVQAQLNGNDLDLDIAPFRVVRERLLFHSSVISVYAQEYETDINTLT
jgi:phage gp37-like protein